jgi:integrase/recombinase XerD
LSENPLRLLCPAIFQEQINFKEKKKMDNILERLQEDLELRGLAKETKKHYFDHAKRFLLWAGKPAEELDEQNIRQFLKYLITERQLSVSSVNIHNSALRFLYAVTLNRNLNYRQIPRLKQIRHLPGILTKEEIGRVFDVCKNLKHRAILMTIYGSGLRLSEISHLKVSDIDSKTMRIFVNQGKGGKDRYSILSQVNLEVLREYWKQYKPTDWLFEGRIPLSRISNRTVQDAFKKWKQEANILKPASIHTIRHCFASHLLETGTNIIHIKKLLGHTHIQSTTFYLHLANFDPDIKSPLDTLSTPPKKKAGKKSKQKDEGQSNA